MHESWLVPMKVYLDVCCLNRPYDDQTQDRVHLECEAVLLILSRLDKQADWPGALLISSASR